MLHMKITVKFVLVKYRKFQTIHENTRFFTFKPLGKYILQKTNFDDFCGTNIYLTKKLYKTIHSTAYLSGIIIRIPFVWVSISIYIDNDTSKMPILAKIGVCVKGFNSKIWN